MIISSVIKKSTWLFFPVIIISGLISFRKASGGHPGTTGAPDEPSCAYSGCHNGPVMSGNTVSSFSFSDPDTSYLPGQTYTITLSLTKSGIDKFGFEMVAIQDSNEVSIGSFTVTDSVNTHRIYGWINSQQRWYMTHTLDGSVPAATGSTFWTFEWTAPNFNAGDITFYYGMNCANNDGTPNGDEIYTNSFKIHSATGANTEEVAEEKNVSIRWNYLESSLQLEILMKKKADAILEMTDLNGKIIFTKAVNLKKGDNSLTYEVSALPVGGIYLINLVIYQRQKISRKIKI